MVGCFGAGETVPPTPVGSRGHRSRACPSQQPRTLPAARPPALPRSIDRSQLARDERVCRSPEFHEFLRAAANVRVGPC